MSNTLYVSNTAAYPYYFETVHGARISQIVVSALFDIQQP